MSAFEGVLTAMVTPFTDEGELDLPACRNLAAHLLSHGSDGLVLAGTTGESPTLDDAEKLALFEAVRAEVGEGVPLIAGTGSNDTRHTVELTKRAEETGVDGALVVTPYYNNPNPAGIDAHFEAVAAATQLPIVIYNIPARSVKNIPPDQLDQLAQIPNVVAVKQANDAELGQVRKLEELAGNDNVFADCLERGGVGGICVASHLVGEPMRELADAFAAGDADRGRSIDEELQPLYEALATTSNPIPVKTALGMLGICSERMRLPMVPATDEQRTTIRAALTAQGLEPTHG
ncbi:MAG: 4-hydroxy-tetrahydrodipicolinate synthase [Solirubrobacterales bacterium]